MHCVHALDCAAEKVPAAQLAHSASATAPLLLPILPAEHGRHAPDELAPELGPYVPKLHSRQLVKALYAPNFPASHNEHDDAEEFEEYLPALQ